MQALRLVGYWNGEHDPGWPDAHDFVDPTWDEGDRDVVRQYLSYGTPAKTYMGLSLCRFCGGTNGYGEFTDGTYIWPTGLAHYVDEHHVRLLAEFVRHALTRLEAIDGAEVDESWWRETRPD